MRVGGLGWGWKHDRNNFLSGFNHARQGLIGRAMLLGLGQVEGHLSLVQGALRLQLPNELGVD
jgi:hypothetical protein